MKSWASFNFFSLITKDFRCSIKSFPSHLDFAFWELYLVLCPTFSLGCLFSWCLVLCIFYISTLCQVYNWWNVPSVLYAASWLQWWCCLLYNFMRSHLLIINLNACALKVLVRESLPVPMSSKHISYFLL